MRALGHECGQHLKAEDNDGLFEKARAHAHGYRPQMGLSDEQVRGLVQQEACDS